MGLKSFETLSHKAMNSSTRQMSLKTVTVFSIYVCQVPILVFVTEYAFNKYLLN